MIITVPKSLLSEYTHDESIELLNELINRISDDILRLYNRKYLSSILNRLYQNEVIKVQISPELFINSLSSSLIIEEYQYEYVISVSPKIKIRNTHYSVKYVLRAIEYGSMSTPPSGAFNILMSRYESEFLEYLELDTSIKHTMSKSSSNPSKEMRS